MAALSNASSCQLSQTPVKSSICVPPGHLVASSRWKGTPLISSLRGKVMVMHEDQLGVADFYPSSDIGIVYVSEADQVMGNMYRRKLAKLRKANLVRGIVIAEKTATSAQYFTGLQRFAVLELGLVIIPVSTQPEAANILIQLVNLENKSQSNPFLKPVKRPPPDVAVLAVVQSIPRLGGVKARALLERFKSIHAVCTASEEELSRVVGASAARHIRMFFENRKS